MNSDIKKEILNLIALKQEGGYWDFKREWYKEGNKTDLLHDIICMANNLENRDAYIIIGVDEADDYKLVDIAENPNRKNTQQIVTFLRDKNFSGSLRPTVFVEEININSTKIDVIVVKNGNATPYYLINKFRGIHANNVYTRIQDTNTPIDSTADLDKVEYLWKKRFGLHQTPIERIEIYMENYQDWVDSSQGEMHKYYKHFPEFTIDYHNDSDGRDGYVYYLFSQTDSTPRYHDIIIKYHQTVLTELQGVSLDGGRYFTPVPRIDGISFTDNTGWDISFRYMAKDSFHFKLNEFLYLNEWSHEAKIAREDFFSVILIFENEMEKENFKYYVIENKEKIEARYDTIHLPHIPYIEGYVKDAFKVDYKNALILNRMLVDFKEER